MKYFLKKIVLFSIKPILLITILLFFTNQIHEYSPSTAYYSDEFNKAFNQKDFELIAIGNSKLLSSIDKKVLEEKLTFKSAILGYSSSNISISKLTLESYLNKCLIKPKLVLLEVSWFTFNKERTHFHRISGDLFLKDFKLWQNYLKYYPEINNKIGKSITKTLKNSIIKSQDDRNYDEKFLKKTPYLKEYSFEKEKFEIVFPNYIAGIDDLLLKDFESIVKMCLNNNIHLILYSAPEDEEYSKMQKDNKEVKDIFIKTALNSSTVSFLDYTLGGELWDKKHEMWLKNSHHINENDLFTKTLSKDIKSILVK